MIIEKDGKFLSVEEFEKLIGVRWSSQLDFENYSEIEKEGMYFHKKGKLSAEQLWLGKYFQKEIQMRFIPDVAIRWINIDLGWGVFALKNFKKMQFITEYTGKVRKRNKLDDKNAYCFEYTPIQGVRSHYTIDAMDQGGLGRYINHNARPNLYSSLATFDNVSHVIFYTKEPIAKETQLCYDYGPDYWAKRLPPISL